MRNNEQTHSDLIQWGLWSKSGNDAKLGFPRMTPFRRLAGATLDWDYDIKDVPTYLNISDEEACRIDKVISSLDLDLRTIIYLRYVKNMKIVKIEKKMKLSRNKGRVLLDTSIRIVSHSSYPQAM